jgi:hypothetical protein
MYVASCLWSSEYRGSHHSITRYMPRNADITDSTEQDYLDKKSFSVYLSSGELLRGACDVSGSMYEGL